MTRGGRSSRNDSAIKSLSCVADICSIISSTSSVHIVLVLVRVGGASRNIESPTDSTKGYSVDSARFSSGKLERKSSGTTGNKLLEYRRQECIRWHTNISV